MVDKDIFITTEEYQEAANDYFKTEKDYLAEIERTKEMEMSWYMDISQVLKEQSSIISVWTRNLEVKNLIQKTSSIIYKSRKGTFSSC